MIKAEVVADSINIFGDRLTTLLVTMPRIILAEFNTHRIISKNSASSRAIPTEKMIESIKQNPFIPMAWQKKHKGMQGTEYITDPTLIQLEIDDWLSDRDYAIRKAIGRMNRGITKQIINRPLESFMWVTDLVSATEWENFFNLRCPNYKLYAGPEDIEIFLCQGNSWKEFITSNDGMAKDWDTTNVIERLKLNEGQAEIHMMAVAEAIYDAKKESIPILKKAGQWHIPFNERIDEAMLEDTLHDIKWIPKVILNDVDFFTIAKINLATTMAAQTSYTTIGTGKETSYARMLEIHDQLITADPLHASPMEHCSMTMGEDHYDRYVKIVDNIIDAGWCRNFKGFIQYRHLIETA